MLSAGPASSCDVCYERFVKDRKIPTSIACGHVFCNTCVGQITRTSGDGDGLCPLCRKSFNYATCVKLHVDLESDTPKEDCPDEDLRQARKLQEAIAKIADEGISETKLRQLIQEAKAFLNTQPRNLHRELRVAHRMVSYLCEVKSSLRAQKLSTAKLNDEIAQLTKEKAGLLKQIEEAEEAHRAERESAMAVENSLRSSYNDAIEVYHATIDLYNKVAQQNSELMAKLSAHLTTKRPNHQEASIAPAPATTQTLLTPAVTAGHLQEVGVRDPNSSFLISPLPQFTSNLPTVSSRFAPLPDLTEEEEETYGERNGHSDDDEDDEGLFTEDEQPLPPPLQRRGSENNLSLVPSGLSRTAPNSYVHNDYRRTRSHSYSNQPTSRSHSPSSSTIASSPSASPPSKNGQSIPPSQPRKIQDGRLKEILSYSPPTSSSFSSQSSGSFPSSYSSRDSSHSYDAQVSSRSYTDSISSKTPTPSHQQQPITTSYSKQQSQQTSTSDNYAHLLASHPHSHLTKTAPSPSPNFQNKVSTASAQAQKLEEERLRKRREMEQEKLLQEYNEQHRTHDTETRMKGLSSGISTASAATVTSAGAQAQLLPRRDHYSSSTYVTPVITSNTTAGTWRPTMNGSHAGSYGRPLPGTQPVTVYDQHHQTKYMASGNNSYPTKTSALPVNSTGVVSS